MLRPHSWAWLWWSLSEFYSVVAVVAAAKRFGCLLCAEKKIGHFRGVQLDVASHVQQRHSINCCVLWLRITETNKFAMAFRCILEVIGCKVHASKFREHFHDLCLSRNGAAWRGVQTQVNIRVFKFYFRDGKSKGLFIVVRHKRFRKCTFCENEHILRKFIGVSFFWSWRHFLETSPLANRGGDTG